MYQIIYRGLWNCKHRWWYLIERVQNGYAGNLYAKLLPGLSALALTKPGQRLFPWPDERLVWKNQFIKKHWMRSIDNKPHFCLSM